MAINEKVFAASVSVLMIDYLIGTTRNYYQLAKEIAPTIQGYTGPLGASFVEFGLPAAVLLIQGAIGTVATVATYIYIKKVTSSQS